MDAYEPILGKQGLAIARLIHQAISYNLERVGIAQVFNISMNALLRTKFTKINCALGVFSPTSNR